MSLDSYCIQYVKDKADEDHYESEILYCMYCFYFILFFS